MTSETFLSKSSYLYLNGIMKIQTQSRIALMRVQVISERDEQGI